jgi:hypothetical protein
LENPWKIEKIFRPTKLGHARVPAPARPRSLTGGPRLSAPTRSSFPLSLSLFCGVTLSALWPVVCSRICAVGLARQSLPPPPPSTARLHGPRARTSGSSRPRCHPAPNRHPDPLYKSPRTPPPPPCLAHFASAHSPKLRAPAFQACRSFPVARPPAPESAAGRARPSSTTMLHPHQAQPRHRFRPTRGEFSRRTFFSLSPIFSVSSISQW